MDWQPSFSIQNGFGDGCPELLAPRIRRCFERRFRRRKTMNDVDQLLERSQTAGAGDRSGTNGRLMNVGFIGLGQMGAGMAANLLKAGHRVTVYNRTPARADALVKQGARRAASIAEACRGDAVITMLANDAAVESVVL
jgi:phosphoglycerate dehydrogenase-like enzyme